MDKKVEKFKAFNIGGDEYVYINEAAQILGVTPGTLRNWDRAGKIKTERFPMNRYRVYSKKHLLALLETIRN